MDVNLYAGTIGQSVWFSKDLGETWSKPYSPYGMNSEGRVWALSSHPAEPGQMLVGTDSGLYRWDEAAGRYTHLPSPLDMTPIWALAQDPRNPATIIAGVRPAALWRSDDSGRSWRKLPVPMAESCELVLTPRVTQILFDPDEPDTIWAGVEIDAVYRSRDGGETWERLADGLVSGDIHGIAVMRQGNARTLWVTTNKGPHRSRDEGASWQHVPLESPWQYTRAVVPRADGSGVVFMTNGDGPPGSTGRLLRSRDHGGSWEDVGLPGETNSTPWWVATHAADPALLFTCTNLGQMFRSTDGGESWTKLRRELGEIRTMMWRPSA